MQLQLLSIENAIKETAITFDGMPEIYKMENKKRKNEDDDDEDDDEEENVYEKMKFFGVTLSHLYTEAGLVKEGLKGD